MKIPIFLALAITVFAQRPARNDNSVQCNAMAGNLLRQIRDPSAMKAKPEFTLDMQKIFASTLDYQLQSSMNELGSLANANLPYLNSVDSRNAVQTIKDKGIIGIWTIRTERVDALGYTYDKEMFTLAQAIAKNPTWEHSADFSMRVSRFCRRTLGAMDNIKAKIIGDIQSFVKRSYANVRISQFFQFSTVDLIKQETTDRRNAAVASYLKLSTGVFDPIANDVCASTVTEIFQKLSTTRVWDAPTKEAIRMAYLTKVGPAAHEAKTAITNAYDDFRYTPGGAEKVEELRVIKEMDIMTLDAFRNIDVTTFMEHFEPRIQAAFIQPNTVALIANDMANICRGAIEDYPQIREQSKIDMEQISKPASTSAATSATNSATNSANKKDCPKTEKVKSETTGMWLTQTTLCSGEILRS